jgi:hypothetical protein
MTAASRPFAVLALIAGVVTFVIFVAFNLLSPTQAAMAGCGWTMQAISDLQMARTPEAAFAAFGPVGCQAEWVAATSAVNRLDLMGLIPAYALFMAFAAVAVAGSLRTSWALLGVALTAAAAAGDVLETRAELGLAAGIAAADQPEWAALLATANAGTWLKFFAIAGVGIVIAALALRRSRRLLAIAGTLPAPAAALAFFVPAAAIVLAGAVGLFWIALLAVAASIAVRGR